jgi:hypothetical protein
MAKVDNAEYEAAMQRSQSSFPVVEQRDTARRVRYREMTKEERRLYRKRKREEKKYGSIASNLKWVAEIDKKESQVRTKRKKGKTPLWVRRKIARDKVLPKNKVCRFCNRGPLKSKQFVVKKEWVGCLICWRTGVGRTDHNDGSKEK